MPSSSTQSILNTEESIGREDAIDLYKLALPILKARLNTMQSAKSAGDAAIEARKLISSVLIFGSESLQKLLTDLRNENYSEQQLPQMITAVCRELRSSIREISDWIQINQRMRKKTRRQIPEERTLNQDFAGKKRVCVDAPTP